MGDSTFRLNKFDIGQIEEERQHSHAKQIPTGFPDVYVNGEDVTVTVDPVGNSAWIRDDATDRHAETLSRGALKDHKGVVRVAHLIDDTHLIGPPSNFVPTSTHLDKLDKFTPHCVSNSTRGYVAADKIKGYRHPAADPRVGKGPNAWKLPVLEAMKWRGQLQDVPDWLTEAMMWDSRDRDARFFDCRGTCR